MEYKIESISSGLFGVRDPKLIMVEEWQRLFGRKGHFVADKPTLVYSDISEARTAFFIEETKEYHEACRAGSLVDILDALIDLQYFLYGAVLIHGLQDIWEEAFQIVHQSNMSKLGEDGYPIVRKDGKILKGPNYWKPEEKLKELLND